MIGIGDDVINGYKVSNDLIVFFAKNSIKGDDRPPMPRKPSEL